MAQANVAQNAGGNYKLDRRRFGCQEPALWNSIRSTPEKREIFGFGALCFLSPPWYTD